MNNSKPAFATSGIHVPNMYTGQTLSQTYAGISFPKDSLAYLGLWASRQAPTAQKSGDWLTRLLRGPKPGLLTSQEWFPR